MKARRDQSLWRAFTNVGSLAWGTGGRGRVDIRPGLNTALNLGPKRVECGRAAISLPSFTGIWPQWRFTKIMRRFSSNLSAPCTAILQIPNVRMNRAFPDDLEAFTLDHASCARSLA